MTADRIRRALSSRFPAAFQLQGEIFAVGGALRDLLLEATPPDLDLVARGAAESARRLATIVGSRVVVLGREPLAVYRVPAGVIEYDIAEMTGGSIEEDLGRRDFTLNAMALAISSSEGLIDPFGGLADIERRQLRMISPANLESDPLRVMRGVRLASRFRLEIEPRTLATLQAVAPGVIDVAPERLTAELDLLLQGRERGEALQLLRSLSLDSILLGERMTEGQQVALEFLEGDHLAAYALLFADWLPARIDDFAYRWRWSDLSRREIQKIVTLIRAAEAGSPPLPVALFEAGRLATARAVEVLTALGQEASAEAIRSLVDRRGAELFSMRPFLDGNAIAGLTGLAPGPQLGIVSRRLLRAQLEGSVSSEVEAQRFVNSVFRELNVDVADRDGDIEE